MDAISLVLSGDTDLHEELRGEPVPAWFARTQALARTADPRLVLRTRVAGGILYNPKSFDTPFGISFV